MGERVDTVCGPDGLGLQKTNWTNVNWTKLSEGVPVHSDCALVYDSVNDVVVLLLSDMSEIWTYRFSEDYWTRKNPAPEALARNRPSPAFDESCGRLVIFNGETWTYDVRNDTWSNKTPAISPPEVSCACMVYDDATGQMVLFGGTGNGSLLNETWTYSLTSNKWTNMSPAESPPARTNHAMAYDSVRDKVVLFGGFKGSGHPANWTAPDWLNDTWTYDLPRNIWTNMSPLTVPPQREMHCLVYDSHRDEVVLFGGRNWNIVGDQWIDEVELEDTWTYFVGTNTWFNKTKFDPGPRTRAGATFDPIENRTVLFGGYGGDDAIWTYSPGFDRWWAKTTTNIPSPRSYYAMAYDPVFNEIVLFGGRVGYYYPFTFLNDTYVFNLSTNTWKNNKPNPSPPAQASQTMVYDNAIGEMVLFGLSETWTYDVGANLWTEKAPKVVPDIQPQAMAYDSRLDLTVLIGQSAGSTQTWTYNSTGDSWVDMNPINAPPPLVYPELAFDSNSGEMILFGGQTWSGQTWTYNISENNWTERSATPAPSAWAGVAMAYYAAEYQIVIFGGFLELPRISGVSHETWAYGSGSTTWMELNTDATPSGRVGHRMVYDGSKGRIIIFGGEFYPGEYVRTEVWAFSIRELSDEGTYTSEPFDAGGQAYFGTFDWEGVKPTGTSVRFQIRTADSSGNLSSADFRGPDGTASTFYERSGTRINDIHNGSRWIQYKACLWGAYRASSPLIRSVTVKYNLMHSIKLASPSDGEEWTGNQNISWSAHDPDNDSLSFDVFLETGSVRVPLATGLVNGTTVWPLNTDLYPNGTYRIRVIARDGNPSIPLVASAVTGDFKILHPAPPAQNHPPGVALIWPPDGSCILNASVGLVWNGTDSDGDSLTYSVYFKDAPLLSTNDLRTVTMDNKFEMDGLVTNTTYYWTVDAWDGNANCTDHPPPIWSFTVILPPGNVPVRITSVPPTQARVGEEYVYCVTSIDEDGDVPSFLLSAGPANMSIDNVRGKLVWIPSESDVGNHTITVLVTDNRGSFARQTYILTVLPIQKPPPPPVEPPRCNITYPANSSTVKERFYVQGIAVNGTSPLRSVQVRIDNGGWIVALGLENWTQVVNISGLRPGRHRLEARAFDGALLSNTDSIDFNIGRPDRTETTVGNNWLLPFVLVVIVACLAVFMLWRTKKGSDRGCDRSIEWPPPG
jgi:hypothetical protein